MYYSSLGFLLIIPTLIITIYAQAKVHFAFAKASKIKNSKGLTGSEIAKRILAAEGLSDIPVNPSKGKLSDHYDPTKKTLNLSPEVFAESSIAALGVAAHEVGHAIQHKASYPFLMFRSYMYPVVSFSSYVAPILIMLGFIIQMTNLLFIGIILFAASVVFTLVTLPVEFDASRRAMAKISDLGLVTGDEAAQVKKVLSAAALTYVAAALTAILELIRLIIIARSRN